MVIKRHPLCKYKKITSAKLSLDQKKQLAIKFLEDLEKSEDIKKEIE